MTESADTPFPLTLANLPWLRPAFAAEISRWRPPTRAPEVFEAGGVELRRYRPADGSAHGTIFAVHGGGYLLGTPAMMDGPAERLSDATGAAVVHVEYPLAPEHPHPAALHACHAGLAALELESGPLIVTGDSAGGGLAAALLLTLARDGGPHVTAAHLHQPMLDWRTGGPSDPRHTWTAEFNAMGWNALLGGRDPASFHHPEQASPALADSLSGFPPTLLTIGQVDLFLGETLDFAARLSRAGVATTLHTYPGAVHGFTRAMEGEPCALHFEADRLAFLRRHLAA